jgi:alkylation response protein AidB-like acyl-CoA dehydrogenase
MTNYFSDNRDLQIHFSNMELREIVDLLEAGYIQRTGDELEPPGPGDYEEAIDVYRESLELLGDISANFVAPRSASIDASGSQLRDGKVIYATATEEARKKLAESGFMGVMLPRKYGGSNFPATVYMMMIEILSRADASLMTLFGYQDVGELIARFGSQEQAEEFLPGLASGAAIGAIVLSEPGAGSDLLAIKLKATEEQPGEWVLNGVKHFISNGGGDVLMVLARSEEKMANIFGLSLFVCPRSDGVQVARIEEKMGLHGSPTCELIFDNAPAQLIGKRRVGLAKYILESLNQARFSVAAQALGIAEGAYRQARDYAEQRVQFGEKIAAFPAIRDMLDSMQTSLASNRAMLYEGVKWLDLKVRLEEAFGHDRIDKDSHEQARQKLRQATRYVNLLSPLVKYAVTESANVVCYNAQQIFGGLGYMRETGIEQLVRDVRITTIYEGTSQIQVAASLKFIVSDVLTELFDQWHSTDYAAELGDIVSMIGDTRVQFDEYLAVLRDYDNDRVKDAAARDLADIYSQIFASYLLLREAAVDPDREKSARQFAILSLASVISKLTALRKGKYDNWV